MTIRAVIVDPAQNAPVVVLQTEDRESLLPIWVGLPEASAIAMALEEHRPPRPMTHDLLVHLMVDLHARLEMVRIASIENGVFHGELHLRTALGEATVVDCRPSDAVAVAVRVQCPIHAADSVLSAAGVPALSEEHAVERILDALRPEDLGRYEM